MATSLKQRFTDLDDKLLIPRELSWLSFNQRVLQEASDPSVPVIERLRYLGIFSNNQDEFFRVRVAEVHRLITLSSGATKHRAKLLLEEIQSRVQQLQKEFEKLYRTALKDLRENKIYLINEEQLDSNQSDFVRKYFFKSVLPELDPILLRENLSPPELADELLYLAIDILSSGKRNYAIVGLPTDRLPRFVEIPNRKRKVGTVYMALDNIIRKCLADVFRGAIQVDESRAYSFKFSRDAEIELDTGITESLVAKMQTSIKQRKRAQGVRFVYDGEMPPYLLEILFQRFGFGKYDTQIPGGRYHNSKDFIAFPNPGAKQLEFSKMRSIRIPELDRSDRFFSTIRERDFFLYYPYHPFDYVIDILKTAALDPDVSTIRICLYRVASNSRVANALVNAVQNGKRVEAVVELAARFDEEANIEWAQWLTQEGIEVIFGVPGLKVHSKLFLIERKESGSERYYSYVGTGNLNENTSKLYTDFALITADQQIGRDVRNVFDFLKYTYKRPNYRSLIVSPHSSRSELEYLIETEITNAEEGYRAALMFKCNNLIDPSMVSLLYKASQAGVEIRLIVRGMCSIVPGIPGVSDNIQAISIVDRYLEHARAYVFHNKGDPVYYIGSADLMTRNIDYRVEVLCPVLDISIQTVIQDILDQQWHDTVKSRKLDASQKNRKILSKSKSSSIRSQETIHRYLATGRLPRYPKSDMRSPIKRRRKKPNKQ